MYICLALIERITADGVLQTYRIAPKEGDGSVVVDWLRDIEPAHRAPGSADFGPFRVYGFEECVLQAVESRPRAVQFQEDRLIFSFEHRDLPIPMGPAFYSLTLPPGFKFNELDIDTHGSEVSNKIAIIDSSTNLLSIAFEFWHQDRRGSISVHGSGEDAGDLTAEDVENLPGYYLSEYQEDTLSFLDAMYDKRADEIRALLTRPPEHAEKVAGERMYDIVLSFAGEDRETASTIALGLRNAGLKVFFDEHERANLWGKNLYDHLAWVYKDAARYCLALLSENYAKKAWTSHERQNAQARAFMENREYILPVKLDDAEIKGIPETIGYIDLRNTTVEELVHLACEKLSSA